MARTVSDVAFLDALITGERAPVVDLRRVRIAIPSDDFWPQEPVDPGVAAVVRDAFAKLRDAGCTLIEIDFGYTLTLEGRDDDAVVELRRALQLEPTYWRARRAGWCTRTTRTTRRRPL